MAPDEPTARRGNAAQPGKRGRQAGAGKWAAVELAYVQGTVVNGELTFPTQAELAKQFNLPVRTVELHCVNEGWVRKRDAFLDSVARDRARTRRAEMLREAERFDSASLTAAKSVLAQVLRHFRGLVEDATRILSPQALERLVGAAEKAQRMGRLVLNMPTGLIETPADAEHRQEALAADVFRGILDATEAARLAELEARVERGELDVIELYRALGGVFKAEQKRAEALPPAPGRRR